MQSLTNTICKHLRALIAAAPDTRGRRHRCRAPACSDPPSSRCRRHWHRCLRHVVQIFVDPFLQTLFATITFYNYFVLFIPIFKHAMARIRRPRAAHAQPTYSPRGTPRAACEKAAQPAFSPRAASVQPARGPLAAHLSPGTHRAARYPNL